MGTKTSFFHKIKALIKSFFHKIKALIKSFTPYQITYLVVVFTLTACFAIFFPDKMLDDTSNTFVVVCSVIAVLANPVCELLISKQSKMNFLVDIFFIELPEFVLCVYLGWYTLATVTLIFWIPIDVVSYIRWTKHPDLEKEEKTVVKRLKWYEANIIIFDILLFGFGVGYLLTLIPGAADSYLDALVSATGMANGILLLLRYNEQWFAWFVTLILYTVMYIISGSYVMLITVAAMFVNTCYGFIKWLLYTKRHEIETENA